MSLSVRNAAALRSTSKVASRRNRSTAVVVRANFLQDIGAGFVRIFSPLRMGNKEDWEGTDTNFTGKIQHHGDPGSRRPFKDGWTAEPRQNKAEQQSSPAPSAPAEGEASSAEGDNVISFLNKAAEKVVAHNFTGDATEPKEWKEGKPQGWTGDIHTRDKDGFHAKK